MGPRCVQMRTKNTGVPDESKMVGGEEPERRYEVCSDHSQPGMVKWIGGRKNLALREATGVSLALGVRLPGELRQWKPKVVMEVAERLVRQVVGRD